MLGFEKWLGFSNIIWNKICNIDKKTEITINNKVLRLIMVFKLGSGSGSTVHVVGSGVFWK